MANERPVLRVRQTPAGVQIQCEANPAFNGGGLITHNIPINATVAEVATGLTAAATAITAKAAETPPR